MGGQQDRGPAGARAMHTPITASGEARAAPARAKSLGVWRLEGRRIPVFYLLLLLAQTRLLVLRSQSLSVFTPATRQPGTPVLSPLSPSQSLASTSPSPPFFRAPDTHPQRTPSSWAPGSTTHRPHSPGPTALLPAARQPSVGPWHLLSLRVPGQLPCWGRRKSHKQPGKTH